MLCIHHNDLDGRCAAYWVDKHFRGKEPVEFIEMNYDREFPLDDIKEGEIVWIVDFSLTPEMMTKLLEKTKEVVWIDHHESVIEEYKGFEEDIPGIRYIGRCGAYLTWLYTTREDFRAACAGEENGVGNIEEFIESMWDSCPYATKLVDDYDVFILSMVNTMPFYYGTCMEYTAPDGPFWYHVHSNEKYLDQLINVGKVIQKYTFRMNNEWLGMCGYEATMNGKKCFVMNTPAMGSMTFGEKLNKYPFVAKITWNGEFWNVSLYSNKETGEDVSKIAQKQMFNGRSGGGHVNAAGFFCEELPFKKVANEQD